MKKFIQERFITCCISLLSIILFSCNENSSTKKTDKDTADNRTMDTHMDHKNDTRDTTMKEHAMATLSNTTKDTALSGTTHFTAQNGKVKMVLQLTVPALANKSVAVHFHEMGDCGDMGKAAHGHWNPTNQQHGKWGSASFHSGDIGNISLDKDGKGSVEIETDLWTIGGGEKTNILNRSLIVHSGIDDYTTQPTGNSGSRIGCGVIN